MLIREIIQENSHTVDSAEIDVKTLGNIIAALQQVNSQGAGIDISPSHGLIVLGTFGTKGLASQYVKGVSTTQDGYNRLMWTDGTSFTIGREYGEGVAGSYNSYSQEIRIASRKLKQITDSAVDSSTANTVIHEILHRGLAVYRRLYMQGTGISLADGAPIPRLLPPEDFRTGAVWDTGWGQRDPKAWDDIVNSQTGYNLQVNPEHCLIYSVLESNDPVSVQDYIMDMVDNHPVARQFFSRDADFTATDQDGNFVVGTEQVVDYWKRAARQFSQLARDYFMTRWQEDFDNLDRSKTKRLEFPVVDNPMPDYPPLSASALNLHMTKPTDQYTHRELSSGLIHVHNVTQGYYFLLKAYDDGFAIYPKYTFDSTNAGSYRNSITKRDLIRRAPHLRQMVLDQYKG